MVKIIKKRLLAMAFVLAAVLVVSIMTVGWALDSSTPIVTATSPANGAVVTATATTVSFTVYDPDEIMNSGFYVKVNGVTINSSFQYKGHWEVAYNTCGGGSYSVWVGDSYKEATISGTVSNLKDGIQNVEVQAKDKLGNVVDKTLTFTVAIPPVISNLTPADGAVVNGADTVSAKIYDPSGLDFSKLNLSVDGKPIVFNTVYNPDGSIVVSYTDAALSDDGNHVASLAAADTFGNSVTKQWKFYDGFIAGVAGQFTRFEPEDTIFNTSHPSFQVHFSDPNNAYDLPPLDYIDEDDYPHVRISSGTRVLIDGVKQADNERGDGINYGDKLPTVTGVAPEYSITYNSNTISDGNHTITFTVPSTTGGSPAEFSKTFTVNSPPVISRHLPVNNVSTSTPTVSVRAFDNSGVTKAVFSIDGNAPVTVTSADSTSSGSETTFPYAAPKLSDGHHVVNAVVYDSAGLSVETSWSFTVVSNTGVPGSAMPVNNDATCQNCHPTDYYRGDSSVAGKHPLVPACQRCHTVDVFKVTSFQYCTTCHYGGPAFSNNHSSSQPGWNDIQNVRHPISDIHVSSSTGCEKCHSRILTVEHNGKKDRNGNPITCNTCHTGSGLGETIESPLKVVETPSYLTNTPVPNAAVEWAPPVGTTIQRVYLDEYLYHGQSVILYADYGFGWAVVTTDSRYQYDPKPGGMLVQRWVDIQPTAKKIKIYSYGTSYDGTGAYPNVPPLHDWFASVPKVTLVPTSADYQKVNDAIKNKDTRCTACHDKTDHEAVHKDELDANCQTCHAATLTTEHMNNKTTEGKNYTCDTCHSSTSKEAARTIGAQSLSCAGCHKQGHGINLVDKVPGDIPLYTGYQWTSPIEATIFNTDPSTPVGYGAGQVVISKRISDVKPSDLWAFYNSKLPAGGWVLKSPAPATDAASFTAVFAKDKREVTIKAYNTEHSDGTGNGTLGYRIEIWYK